MRKYLSITILLIVTLYGTAAGQRSWEGIHRTETSVLKSNFELPPVEFASHVIWGWQGDMDLETIRHDLDSMVAKGFRSVIFEAGYGLPYDYLSHEWFEAIRVGVLEAKKRGMKVWLIDEGKYPSGFAGGKFTHERPDLRMQALVIFDTIPVAAGQEIRNHEVGTEALSAVAVSADGENSRVVEIEDGKISFRAGLKNWNILLVRDDFRTAQTRAVNNPDGGKDTSNSLCDYLNPVAVRQFIDWTHEQYKKYLGEELGTTVLGFRGDEPDYAHTPWTPAIVETFIDAKGYDPVPYLASLFAPIKTEGQKRFKADYWDVWSAMFADSFFKQQADWCAENGLAHITHLNNEHNMPVCVRAEGDFFRTLSKVQVPGVDAIWDQIWPGTVADFPMLASSVSHVYGKPRAFSESFAAYYTSPTIPQAKYVVDYQIVRGINFFEFMFWGSGPDRPNWMAAPGMKGLNEYTNRATYLIAQGEPGARVAMYYPTSTMWLDNNAVFDHITTLTNTLLEHQYDFDYVNDDAFTEALSVGPGYLQNMSGQKYTTLIIPSADAISSEAWKVIEEFGTRGGTILVWGKKPDMLVGRTFTCPEPFPDFTGWTVEPSAQWTRTVAAAMPRPEMEIHRERERPAASRPRQGEIPVDTFRHIRYTRRVLPDGDMYFIFNEGEHACTFTAGFDKVGRAEAWNASSGTVSPVDSRVENGRTVVDFHLEPWESTIISIKKAADVYDIAGYGAVGDGQTVNTAIIQQVIDKAHAAGGGTITVPEGVFVSGALFFPAGVDLYVARGGVLSATVSPDDFPVIPTRFEGIEREWRCAFLNFTDSPGVRVSGEGTIYGSGVEWTNIVPFGRTGRPRLICFTNCDGGSISGLDLREQASWCLHILYTDGFRAEDLNITSDHSIPSSDGIDVDSSNDVYIARVYIDVNDDCISIKAGKDDDGRRVARPCENILIEDCHFAYGHGGVAIGSEITGGVRNVTVRNCRMDGDNWGPIRFKSQPSRGGVVENILFEDIVLNDTRSMLDINMEWRMVGELAPVAPELTRLRNIRIRNVTGNVRSAGTMFGYADAPFGSDVFHFENCHVDADRGLRFRNAGGVSFEGLEIHVAEGEAIMESDAQY